ncbi:MAG: efflux RND transporter periplasmic adaptor subunit [Terriglobia bacterium]
MPNTRRFDRLWLRLGAVFCMLLSLAGCSKPPSGDEGADTEESPANTVATVTLTKVVRGDISSNLTVSGTIAALPNQDVKVSALVPGRISAMLAAEGDHVDEGSVLARIEDHSYRDQLQQAEASIDQANANLENARVNKKRNADLFQRGIAAQKDLEDSATAELVAQAALKQAQSAAALARLQLSRTEVKSPLRGIIVKRLVSAGEQVDGTGAQPIFEIANTAEVELFGNVPAVYLPKIHVGQVLPVRTDAFPNADFSGRVVAISPAVDPTTNVGLVRIRINNAAGLLRLGMFLSAQIALETHKHVLVVAPEAVYRDAEGQPRIFRVHADKAEAVAVKLGIETHDRVELLSGAEEGEVVVLTGAYGLGSGAGIKVKQ